MSVVHVQSHPLSSSAVFSLTDYPNVPVTIYFSQHLYSEKHKKKSTVKFSQ